MTPAMTTATNGARKSVALALGLAWSLAAPAVGYGQNVTPHHGIGHGDVDLRVRTLPAPDVGSLHMRAAALTHSRAAASQADSQASPGPVAIPNNQSDRQPRSLGRTVQENVVFRFNVGYQLQSSAVSGERGLSGYSPDDASARSGQPFANQRQYALGDLTLGTDGWLVPSMSTYFASKLQFSIDGATSFTALANPFDADDGRAILVRAAYAEIDGIGDKNGHLARLYVRAGRQFRFGSTRFIANFDGLTAAYDAPGFEVSGFVGQRVVLYVPGHRGLIGGGGFKLRGKELVNIPVDLATDYLFVSGDVSSLGSARHYIESTLRAALGAGELSIRSRLADNGALNDLGMGLARIGAGYRQPLGKRVLLTGDVMHLTAREVAYDFITPARVDIVDVAQTLGLGLTPPGDATRLSVRVDSVVTRALEVYGFATANIVHGETHNGFNTSFQEYGGAIFGRLPASIDVTGQYKLRNHSLDASANAPGSSFANLAGSGISTMHELSGELRYRVRAIRSSLSLGGYGRFYEFVSPYVEAAGDAQRGVRFQVDARLRDQLRLHVSGEVAEASPILDLDLGTLTSVRALLEASF